MVIHESYITRKPLEFVLIVLLIVLLLLLPIYFYTKDDTAESTRDTLVAETYAEVRYVFGPESELSEKDKKILFKTSYENNVVQWKGILLACVDLGNAFRVSIDQTGDGYGDVLFISYKNCTNVTKGSEVNYRTKLIDLKVNTFTGKEGEVLSGNN
jgi:hypothetical protein